MPPKRRHPPSTSAAPPPASKPARPSALAKAHHITARTEAEIREAFSLFAVAEPSAKRSAATTTASLPATSLRRALLALACPPASASELASLLEAADPTASGAVRYEDFVAVAALKLEARGADVRRGEVREAWGLFVGRGERAVGGGRRRGGGVGGEDEDEDEEDEEDEGGDERRITIADLRRVARELKEEVGEQVLADMMSEANGGRGVQRGVGLREFEGVMRRAGVFG
ncbi:hypothetical protein MMC15_003079 [Xylographa vitiligo]|nr:hypothetical protein [Xylographa vitiligo]